jgi:hypothetical protein
LKELKFPSSGGVSKIQRIFDGVVYKAIKNELLHKNFHAHTIGKFILMEILIAKKSAQITPNAL